MRNSPRIPEEHLRSCLMEQYDLTPSTLDFLPLGFDYSAAVYYVVSEQGTSYLVKVTSRPLYEPQYLVPHYLNDQGISSIVAPISTDWRPLIRRNTFDGYEPLRINIYSLKAEATWSVHFVLLG
ncbi:hypothetical protein [Paenibacillus eucommiae]|uniref:Aminoglycoside phosphotransferase domain-containing protein n=1 Tax=Paenibacillus eucommiae TaxID=1355755 RepID=A0ABS4J3A7_9BACL|nr:hypothetical protein [Paenibacillus eucommiae]MBP1994329.1 hypothetical protein [Paenibacillus eucommiae]